MRENLFLMTNKSDITVGQISTIGISIGLDTAPEPSGGNQVFLTRYKLFTKHDWLVDIIALECSSSEPMGVA